MDNFDLKYMQNINGTVSFKIKVQNIIKLEKMFVFFIYQHVLLFMAVMNKIIMSRCEEASSAASDVQFSLFNFLSLCFFRQSEVGIYSLFCFDRWTWQ